VDFPVAALVTVAAFGFVSLVLVCGLVYYAIRAIRLEAEQHRQYTERLVAVAQSKRVADSYPIRQLPGTSARQVTAAKVMTDDAIVAHEMEAMGLRPHNEEDRLEFMERVAMEH